MSRKHPYKKLTARSVASTKKPGRFADGGGLYLLIAPGGSKSWMLRTVVHGRRRDIGLGSVSLVSLNEARDEAHRLRKMARSGTDPLAERNSRRKFVPTLAEVAVEVHAAHSRTFKNDKHRKQWLTSLANVMSVLGSRRVDTITSPDILAVLLPNWSVKPETSRRILQRLGAIFEWCKVNDLLRGDNPMTGIKSALPKHKASKDHHAALAYSELPAFIKTLRDSDAGASVKLAFEFTILCAARTSETLHATWNEMDFNQKAWNVPGTRTKSGRDHRVPLSSRCIELLQQAKRLGGEYVFPGRSPSRPLSNMVFLMTLRRLNRPDITAHGFRSTFRDWAEERTHAPRAVSEAALAHVVSNKTEAAYLRTDLFEKRRELMEAWSAFAAGQSGKVMRIRA